MKSKCFLLTMFIICNFSETHDQLNKGNHSEIYAYLNDDLNIDLSNEEISILENHPDTIFVYVNKQLEESLEAVRGLLNNILEPSLYSFLDNRIRVIPYDYIKFGLEEVLANFKNQNNFTIVSKSFDYLENYYDKVIKNENLSQLDFSIKRGSVSLSNI